MGTNEKGYTGRWDAESASLYVLNGKVKENSRIKRKERTPNETSGTKKKPKKSTEYKWKRREVREMDHGL